MSDSVPAVLLTLWNPTAAGAPVMATRFAEGLVAAGHHVVVAHGPPGTSSAPHVLGQLDAAGVERIELAPLTARHAATNLRTVLGLARRPDIGAVLAFQQRDRPLALVAARLAGRPALVHLGARPIHHGPRAIAALKGLAQRTLLRHGASLVLCPSDAVRDSVVHGARVPTARTRVVLNGVDTEAVATAAAAARSSRDAAAGEGRLRLLSVGRLHREKGHHVLLDALGAVDPEVPWELSIVGERVAADPGGYVAALTARARRPALADRVAFAGWRTDVPALLGASDLYVHPSQDGEGWPLAVSEALASGCPTVFTDVVGRPPGFEDGVHGWVVPTGDARALAAAIEHALRLSPADRRRVGEGGAAYAAEHLDLAGCVAAVVQAVEAAMAGRG